MGRPFRGIDHLGIAVHDLEAARKTYGEILGFKISAGEVLEERGLEVAFVETGNARIELLGPTRPVSEISRFLDKRGEGIHHICVRVTDLQGTIENLQKRGARIVGDGIQRGAHDSRVAFLHPKSTHGVLLELVEYAGEQIPHGK